MISVGIFSIYEISIIGVIRMVSWRL